MPPHEGSGTALGPGLGMIGFLAHMIRTPRLGPAHALAQIYVTDAGRAFDLAGVVHLPRWP
jgi:hypothetical protein